MNTIVVESSVSTELDTRFAPTPKRLTISDTQLGQGQFGAVYELVSPNGAFPSTQVVKLLSSTNVLNAAERGFKTIQALQESLREANERLIKTKGTTLIKAYPALAGVPLLSFRGNLNGQAVLGYIADNLTTLGLEDFGLILEDVSKLTKFQSQPLLVRLKMAEDLVNAFGFLSSQLRFIHADIKAEALFVDSLRGRCAIIDYDSGALARDVNDKPSTYGTRQDWLAPEIITQLDAPGNSARIIRVDLSSDIWAVNVCLHYLIVGCSPFFFLEEISTRSMNAYLSGFEWPHVDENFRFFRKALKKPYEQYGKLLNALPSELLTRFKFTFNRGFLDATKRTTYGQWRTIFQSLGKPLIKTFEADRYFVDDLRPGKLTWDVRGAVRLELSGVGDVSGQASAEIRTVRTTDYILTLYSIDGKAVSKTITIQVSDKPPEINVFQADRYFVNDVKPVTIEWTVMGAIKVSISNTVDDLPPTGKMDLVVVRDRWVTLTATSPFGVTSERTLGIEVSKEPPTSVCFGADRLWLTDERPVKMSWAVADSGAAVELLGFGKVKANDSMEVCQLDDREYVLRVTTIFGVSAEWRLTVRVSKRRPLIRYFEVTPQSRTQYGAFGIKWVVDGATDVVLEPIGVVPHKGELKRSFNSEQELTLVAKSYFNISSSIRKMVRPTRRSTMPPIPSDDAKC